MESTISVSGKKTKVGSSLEFHAKNHLKLTLKKYFNDFISSEVLFSKDKLIKFLDKILVILLFLSMKTVSFAPLERHSNPKDPIPE